jgi:ribosomal protein L32
MADLCVNCGNDEGPHTICTDCLELIECRCFKGGNLIDDVVGGTE